MVSADQRAKKSLADKAIDLTTHPAEEPECYTNTPPKQVHTFTCVGSGTGSIQ